MSEPDKQQTESYEAVRPFFKASLEQVVAAGRGARDMVEFTLERLGDAALPHLQRFMAEARAGQVKIKGLTHAAHERVFGAHPTAEERERMIREAAYLRAERRGFQGGSPEEDWWEAEREVDARLADELGLILRGRRAVESLAAAAEREIEETYDLVRQWLGRQGQAVKNVRMPRLLGGKQQAEETPPALPESLPPTSESAEAVAKPAKPKKSRPKAVKPEATAEAVVSEPTETKTVKSKKAKGTKTKAAEASGDKPGKSKKSKTETAGAESAKATKAVPKVKKAKATSKKSK
ncbi:DUF2934 domain-containing protein [Thioalkalivibrio sulfidiphilus]|uniref:DUF2934 domain-containing protein n=1 Tax=Thioalkalivibrio sulfidiphilus TaxID=1033854 RepID=UPI00037F85BB|nr:DUF2934 domain-containing protein [Thioalkalivibrio sulfidiphilus]